MLSPFHLLLLIAFYAQLAHALDITVPAGPILNGATISVGWTATDSDPLSFSLALLCVGKITLQDPVDRGTATNDTGQVSYLTGCLGDHIVQALAANASDTLPLATSGSFQVVSAVAPTTVFTIAPTEIVTDTVFPGLTSTSTSSSTSAALQLSAANNRIRTLVALCAILGATTFILGILLILIYVRLRKLRPQQSSSPEFGVPKPWPLTAHFESHDLGQAQFRVTGSGPDTADSDVRSGSLAREMRDVRAEIERLRAEPQAAGEPPVHPRPPSYHKQER